MKPRVCAPLADVLSGRAMPPDAAIATAPAAHAAIRRATLIGSGAIGLWSTLALGTTLTGAVPPFLMVGLTSPSPRC
jgi:hypothetical protein